jgi:hypothetical protein
MRAIVVVAIVVVGICTGAASVRAQTWTSPRGRPPLWQIVSVDRSGERAWLYDAEDIAGDGAGAFQPDEAAADLRSVYADADRDRLWIRAYVASASAPPPELTMFYFIDVDRRDDTGGAAAAMPLWPDFMTDPSDGGYERAFGVRADGEVLGAWRWDSANERWQEQTPGPMAIEVEAERDRDPIRVAGLEHGYVQVSVEHALAGLDASCAGALFVRSWLETSAQRSFGDAVLSAGLCRGESNGIGDPLVLRIASCAADSDCPAAGRCRERVCLLEYECGSDVDCRTGERCTGSACVKVVTGSCDADSDCDGLVCEGSSCSACSDNGARACADGLVCTPRGACVDPSDAAAGAGATGGSAARGGSGGTSGRAGSSGSAGDADEDIPPGKVRGGAFHCAAVGGQGHGTAAWLWLAPLLACALGAMRRRGRRASASRDLHKAGRS